MFPCQPDAQQSLHRLAPAGCGGKWRCRFPAVQTDATGVHGSEDAAAEDEEGTSRGRASLQLALVPAGLPQVCRPAYTLLSLLLYVGQ